MGGEVESRLLLKTSKAADFASLVRYFYFTNPYFPNLSTLFSLCGKTRSLCAKIPHFGAGFLLASRLSTKLGGAGGIRTPGLLVRSLSGEWRQPLSTLFGTVRAADRVPYLPSAPLVPQRNSLF